MRMSGILLDDAMKTRINDYSIVQSMRLKLCTQAYNRCATHDNAFIVAAEFQQISICDIQCVRHSHWVSGIIIYIMYALIIISM